MKILIKVGMSDYNDLYRKVDYNTLADETKNNSEILLNNFGNKVWEQGIISELSTPENEISFYDGNESWNEINDKYDVVVSSHANLFNKQNNDGINYLASEFAKSKIPVYVISVGAQADSFDNINGLVSDIKDNTKLFLRAIYESGGEIACRGYFTKDVLDKISNNTAEVVGCPSLFQSGGGYKNTKQ